MRFDHFGFIAPYYDRAIPLREVGKFVEHLKLPVDGNLLDAGGGTGRVASALIGLARRLVVADASISMLLQARSKDGLDIVCTISEELPFPNNSFERVIMVDALHHVSDQLRTANELWRILKPGGSLIFLEPDYRKLVIKVVAALEKLLLMRSHFLAPDRIRGMFTQPNAKTSIVEEGFNVWVYVEKL